MSAIKENDRVKVVACENYLELFRNCTGKVTRIFETLSVPIAIVELEDDAGTTIKVHVTDLVKVEVKSQESEIPEGAKLITKEAFDRAVMEATLNAKSPSRILGSLSATIVGHNIGEKIFESEDAVYMTKDQFIATLWDGCSPKNVGESIDNQMSGEKCLHISITAMIGLEQTIEIFFGESDHD